jgi:HAD superfamily hydrolase (TIGR01509 family)
MSMPTEEMIETVPMRLELPPGDFKAYLFDCDGTIADSMPLHYVAWNHVLAKFGCEFPEEQFYEWGGMPIAEIIAALNVQNGLNMPVHEICLEKEQLYYANLPKLQGVPHTLEHIDASHGKLPFAVVSGSTRESVTASLETLGILDKFETLVCAGDYVHAKPHPEPYLMAAERLGIAPEHCLVFEDTDMGIESATAAGMASVKVPSAHLRAAGR